MRYFLRLAMIKRKHNATDRLIAYTYDPIISFNELIVLEA